MKTRKNIMLWAAIIVMLAAGGCSENKNINTDKSSDSSKVSTASPNSNNIKASADNSKAAPVPTEIFKNYEIEKGNNGNTTGNASNYSIAAYSKGWIYYSNTSTDFGIFKMKPDGTSVTKICGDIPYYLNIYNDYIFYRSAADGNVYRVNMDGSNKAKIIDDKAFYVNVSDGYIYYQNESDNKKLYRVKLDGTEKKKLNDEYTSYITIGNGWIYYQDETDGNVLYKIKTDGTGKQRLNRDTSIYLNLSGDWIYYTNSSDGSRLYRIKTDGTSRTKLCDDPTYYINLSGNWIYCSDRNRKNFYKIRTDGTEKTSISNDSSWKMDEFNIVGDWIFYEYYEGNKVTNYRMKTDATMKEKLN